MNFKKQKADNDDECENFAVIMIVSWAPFSRIVQGFLSPLSLIFTLHSSLLSSQLSTSSSQISDPTQSEANPQHSIVVECKVHDLLQSSFIHFSFCPAQWSSANDDAPTSSRYIILENLKLRLIPSERFLAQPP